MPHDNTTTNMTAPQTFDNPLLHPWSTPYGLPPFDQIRPEHFEPAFDVAMPAHLAELQAIADNPDPASFDNTLRALDESGRAFARLEDLLGNLTVSETSPALQAVDLRMAPRIAAHYSAIYLNQGLFARVHAVYEQRQALQLQGEDRRLLERVHLDFERAGACLTGADRDRFAAIAQELASLYTQFGQNVLADEAAFALTLDGPDDLAGLPDFVRAALAGAAAQRGMGEGRHTVTLSPSVAEPFLSFSARRDLRQRVLQARVQRGAHDGAHDNRPLVTRIVALRQEQARLLGYTSYAQYQLADRMAPSVQAVNDLLRQAWASALTKADADRQALRAVAVELGEPEQLQAWDWRYLAEVLRQRRYDLDDAQVKPYFALDNMLVAMFDCAQRLFGIRFVERQGVPLYHPDARLWEVRRVGDDSLVGVFIGDNFARPSKRSGAWMSVFRSQSGHGGATLPIVINNNNFAKASPTLLSADDVRTLFHEFGHGLHGLLSNVQHERLSGTRVLRDFVELPSQLMENWAVDDGVLRQHARHVQTGEPIPQALLDKLRAARRFNQAWHTVQYVAPALIDMALHSRPANDLTPVDSDAFEAAQCAALGVPADIGLRHHLAHFQHLFCGDGYAAGYYVYMWAEVLEADAFGAFEEAGDVFDTVTAQRLLDNIYSRGNAVAPGDAFRAFRGRDPSVTPMLRKRGLTD